MHERRRSPHHATRSRARRRPSPRRLQDVHARRRDELRILHGHAGSRLAPKTTASLVALAKDGYFDDTILHRVVPGFVIQGGDRRQAGSGRRCSTRRRAPSDAALHEGRRGDGEVRRSASRHGRRPVLGGHGSRMQACRRSTRWSVRSRTAWTPAERIDALGSVTATVAAVIVSSVTVGEKLTMPVAAVVLAAGAASRFGSPKQRLLLPPSSSGSRTPGSTRSVVVKGAHELLVLLEHSPARVVPCPDLETRPGASLHCGSRRWRTTSRRP